MRFVDAAMLVMGGMAVGLVCSYYGGFLLWGGTLCALVVLCLVRAWRVA